MNIIIVDSKRRLKDVLMEFREGIYPKYSTEKVCLFCKFLYRAMDLFVDAKYL